MPLLLWLVVITLNLANLDAAGVPGWWAGLLVAIGAAASLWGVNALVISSLFVFRVRDIARLAAYFLLRTPSVTVGNALLLLAAAAVTAALVRGGAGVARLDDEPGAAPGESSDDQQDS